MLNQKGAEFDIQKVVYCFFGVAAAARGGLLEYLESLLSQGELRVLVDLSDELVHLGFVCATLFLLEEVFVH